MKQARILGIVLLVTMAIPVLSQDSPRWDGADDLPVSPLACDATAPERESVDYDGTQPSDAADLTGLNLNILDVPTQIGSAYFTQTATGVDEASREMGDVTVTTDAPTRLNATQQARVIENYVEGLNGLLIAPVEGEVLLPVLEEVLAAGVHVVAYNTDPGPGARGWFVLPVEDNALMKALADNLAESLNGTGSFAIATSTLDHPLYSRWIAELQAYIDTCHPDLTWLETVETGEVAIDASAAASDLLESYGDDLDAIVSLSGVSFAGAAGAVLDANRCAVTAEEGAATNAEAVVVLTGVAFPTEVRRFVTNGCVSAAAAWNPRDLGYAAMQVLRAAIDGELNPGDTRVEAGRLGVLEIINGSVVLLGEPLLFTNENIADFDF